MDVLDSPGGYSTVSITISLPGTSARSFCMAGMTTGCGRRGLRELTLNARTKVVAKNAKATAWCLLS